MARHWTPEIDWSTRSALEVALHAVPHEESQALIVRTLPNDASKAGRV